MAEIDDYLIGDTDARIECDDEGEMYKRVQADNFREISTISPVTESYCKIKIGTFR